MKTKFLSDIEIMEDRAMTLRVALQKCKERFDEYEAYHRAKPDHAKADRNKEMSELCRKALET